MNNTLRNISTDIREIAKILYPNLVNDWYKIDISDEVTVEDLDIICELAEDICRATYLLKAAKHLESEVAAYEEWKESRISYE